jgi:hypothetical protein
MGNIARWTDDEGAEGVVIDGRLSVYAKPSMTRGDGTVAVGIEVPWLDQLQGAVEALRFIADYRFADDTPEGLDAQVMQDTAREALDRLGGQS